MKILYITTVNIDSDSGVKKKIYGQIRAMRKSGMDMELIAPRGDQVVSLNEKGAGEKKIGVLEGYNDKGPFRFFNLTKVLYKEAYTLARENNFDAVFVRYPLSERALLRMLRKLKEDGVKMFLEIPSYPYDLEYENKQWYKKAGLYIDKIFRRKLKKYVDVIFSPGIQQKEIYGIRSESFENGVSIEEIEKRKYTGKKEKSLRFVGVANLNAWHGYDRVIRGIAEYYKNNDEIDFVFNIVGDGIELPNLKSLVEGLGLQERVIFHGFKSGVELDRIYNNSDVAISSVGLYRLGKALRLVLKAREACIKGIPFVAVKGDPVFDEGFDYVFFVKDEESAVNVEEIYDWFVNLKPEEYLKEMHRFAKGRLDWEQTFKKPILIMKDIVGNA